MNIIACRQCRHVRTLSHCLQIWSRAPQWPKGQLVERRSRNPKMQVQIPLKTANFLFSFAVPDLYESSKQLASYRRTNKWNDVKLEHGCFHDDSIFGHFQVYGKFRNIPCAPEFDVEAIYGHRH